MGQIKGQWESYLIDIVDGNLVIAGSDKRGTIYGIYEISERIGVSPWYWMADAPIKHQDEVYYDGGRIVQPSPKVKYRGIFINDEWPSFGTWCTNHFGGVNAKAYEHIFELLLRLKANYFWPAMWATAFNEDDPECPRLADEMGIVMGTSHHEPMMRSHQEYLHRKDAVGGKNQAHAAHHVRRHGSVIQVAFRKKRQPAAYRHPWVLLDKQGDKTPEARTSMDVLMPCLSCGPSSPRCSGTTMRDSPCLTM